MHEDLRRNNLATLVRHFRRLGAGPVLVGAAELAFSDFLVALTHAEDP